MVDARLEPEPRHPAALEYEQLRAECDVRFQRRSGPGGQHRNKVETSVHLTHRPTGVSAAASERRAQAENLKQAWQRLRTRLAVEVRRPWHGPSAIWQSRCQGGRIRVSASHTDFPRLLAEALDALQQHDWQPRQAAAELGCSATQLVRLLQREPAGLAQLNKFRAQRGLNSLKP